MQNVIAVIWDFDKTLVNGYMQDPIFTEYGVNASEFWKDVNALLDKYWNEQNVKVRNIPQRVSIHQRPPEADGGRFGDWEMDTIVGKDGKGAIVTLTERSTNMLLMERLPQGKHPEPLAKVVIRLLFPYRHTIRTITTDNGSEFCAHKLISKALAPKGTKNPNLIFFADSYASWQKGAIENANKLIRQYIPKGTDFNALTDKFIRKIQQKINRMPRKKLNFNSPLMVFFKLITNFAVAS